MGVRVSEHTARKRHRCAACGGSIQPGDRYRALFSLDEDWHDGRFLYWKAHLLCVETGEDWFGPEAWAIRDTFSPAGRMDDRSLGHIRRHHLPGLRAGDRVEVSLYGRRVGGVVIRGDSYVYVLLDGKRREQPYHHSSVHPMPKPPVVAGVGDGMPF